MAFDVTLTWLTIMKKKKKIQYNVKVKQKL